MTGEAFWRFEVDGYSPQYDSVVSDGILYFGAHRFEVNDRVYALDTATEEVIWQVELEGDLRSSPVVVDNSVYISTRSALYALDAPAGETQWHVSLAGGDYHYSVFVRGGSDVYVSTQQGNVYALDAATGEIIWQQQVERNARVAFGNGAVYASSFPNLVTALDAESGALLWKIQLPSEGRYAGVAKGNVGGLASPPVSTIAPRGTLTRPVVGYGMVFVGSDYEYIYALDAATGELVWAFESWGNVRLSPVLADGVLYFASSDYHVYALDAITGSPIWHYDVDSWISAIKVSDSVVFVNADGERVLALTEPEG